jgi:competence protein ComEC
MVPRVVDEFRAAGLAHLLAVSGANLAIVCGAVYLLAKRFRAGPRTAAAAAMAALVGFVVLAGPEPSVLRAAVMGAVTLLALVLGRRRSTLPSLATAVLVLVLIDPALGGDPGFALSVVATAALVLVAPKWARALKTRGVPNGLAEAIVVPTAASLATAPLVAGISGQVSLVAIVANLVAGPVVAPATVLGVAAAAVAPVSRSAAELLVHVAGPAVTWLIQVGRQAATVPGASVGWPDGWVGAIALVVVVAAVVLLLRLKKTRTLVVAVLIGGFVVLVPMKIVAPAWPPDGWKVVTCDVGQGDALVLATDDADRAVVVDTGPDPGVVDRSLKTFRASPRCSPGVRWARWRSVRSRSPRGRGRRSVPKPAAAVCGWWNRSPASGSPGPDWKWRCWARAARRRRETRTRRSTTTRSCSRHTPGQAACCSPVTSSWQDSRRCWGSGTSGPRCSRCRTTVRGTRCPRSSRPCGREWRW